MPDLSQDDIQKTAQLLARLEPGFLPYPIFEQITRLMPAPVVELVPLRTGTDGGVEVLLIERPVDDPVWPGELHTPGTVMRPTDGPKDSSENQQAMDRLLAGELQGTPVGERQYVGTVFHESRRGTEFAQLYWIEVLGEPLVGRFYAATGLPSELVESQRLFISQAVEHYKQQKGF